MRIVINTNYNSAGTKVCVDDLAPRLIGAGHSVVRNDWDNYGKYDFALFMAPDSDVQKAKEANPKILAGIMDPKLSGKKYINEVRIADFLIVSSVEQRDIFLKYNKNIFIYYMFPDIKEMPKVHVKKDKIIIGYHGNKIHLNCAINLVNVLDELAEKYDIEFWVMYNIEKLGKWNKNLPKKCAVRHIQWSEENYYKYLSQCDIGVLPAAIPVYVCVSKIFTRFLGSFLTNNFHYNKNDYLIRFKYSNNPGRIYPFCRLHIPVVADFFPSYSQIIRDGHSGFLVYSREGWYWALEKLINDYELRNTMSGNLKKFIDENFSIDINFKNFLDFLFYAKSFGHNINI